MRQDPGRAPIIMNIRPWHLVVLGLIPLLYAYFGRYCLPYYDDYPSALRVAQDGLWGNIVARYQVACGRILHHFVFSLVSLHMEHLWVRAIFPPLTIATFLAPVYWIVRLLGDNSRREALFLTLVVFAVFFTSYTSLSANLYWLGTVMGYQWSLNGFLVMVGGFLLLADTGRNVGPRHWALLSFGVFVATMGNEIFTLFVLAATLLVTLTAWINGHPRRLGYLALCGFAFGLGALVLVSPGNFSQGVGTKWQETFLPRLSDAAAGAAGDIFGTTLHYLIMPAVLLGLLLFVTVLRPRRGLRLLPSVSLRGHVAGVLVLLAGAVFCSSLVFRLSTGEHPQGRYLNVITVEIFLFAFLICILAAEHLREWLRRRLYSRVSPIVVMVLFVAILCTVKNNYRLVRDNINGTHARHYSTYMENIRLVHAGRGEEVDPTAPSPHAISFRDSGSQYDKELFIEFWSGHHPKTLF